MECQTEESNLESVTAVRLEQAGSDSSMLSDRSQLVRQLPVIYSTPTACPPGTSPAVAASRERALWRDQSSPLTDVCRTPGPHIAVPVRLEG